MSRLALLLAAPATAVKTASNLTYATFYSDPIALKSGQIANTPSDFTLHWPDIGPVAVRHFASEVVDADGTSVPLTEVYVHHWLVFDDLRKGKINKGMCPNLANVTPPFRPLRPSATRPQCLACPAQRPRSRRPRCGGSDLSCVAPPMTTL
eukprot:gene7983-7381_t